MNQDVKNAIKEIDKIAKALGGSLGENWQVIKVALEAKSGDTGNAFVAQPGVIRSLEYALAAAKGEPLPRFYTPRTGGERREPGEAPPVVENTPEPVAKKLPGVAAASATRKASRATATEVTKEETKSPAVTDPEWEQPQRVAPAEGTGGPATEGGLSPEKAAALAARARSRTGGKSK